MKFHDISLDMGTKLFIGTIDGDKFLGLQPTEPEQTVRIWLPDESSPRRLIRALAQAIGWKVTIEDIAEEPGEWEMQI